MLKLFVFIILVASSKASSLDQIKVQLGQPTSSGDFPITVGNFSIQDEKVKKFVLDYKIGETLKGFLIDNGTIPNITEKKSLDSKKDLVIVIQGWNTVSKKKLETYKVFLNDAFITNFFVNYLKRKFPEEPIPATTTVNNLPDELSGLGAVDEDEDGDDENIGDSDDLGQRAINDDDDDVTKELKVDPKYLL